MPLPKTSLQVKPPAPSSVRIRQESGFPAAAGGWDGTADFWFDRDFWFADGTPPADAKVYYLDARGNWNHPGCSAAIVSSRSGRVEYAQYGYTQLASAD